jgi:hypothetical protein
MGGKSPNRLFAVGCSRSLNQVLSAASGINARRVPLLLRQPIRVLPRMMISTDDR